MARIKSPLAEKSVTKLSRRNGMHAVGGVSGLYLCVNGAARSWILRYKLDGKRRDHGIGSFADLTLAEARNRARVKRKGLLDGIDPIDAKREQSEARRIAAARRMTFAQCTDAYLDAKGDAWKNAKHRGQWRSTLKHYAFPVFGHLDVSQVDETLVLQVLEPIWKEKTETASRLRGRIETVLSYAKARKLRSGENPARWRDNLKELLAKPSDISKVKHHAALPYKQISAFMAELREQEGVGAAALEFAILTAARSGEVRGATWDEIDLDARRWKIPGERMKAGKVHTVPLSSAAIAVIERLPRLGDYVFPGAREGRPLSDMSLTAVLRRMDRGDITVHGFRSTFRDWAGEKTEFEPDIAEFALAHKIGDKGRQAYQRGTNVEKRRKMMAAWANYCGARGSNVLPMRRTAKARA